MIRVGHGYDVHKLVLDRPLILGGVEIEWPMGLLGHSDADVVLHAICDALLGAAALGDIGKHFPDTEEKYKGISSRVLLRQVGQLLLARQFVINNIDVTIVAQQPKLAPYLTQMRENIISDLALTVSQLNIKATTTEELGFCGRQEGIAAHAVALLQST